MPLDDDEIKERLKENSAALAATRQDIASIKTTLAVLAEQAAHTLDRCPMRVEIARATNGAKQAQASAETAFKLAEKAVDLTIENRVGLAKLAITAAGGGISGGLVVGIMQYLSQFVQ